MSDARALVALMGLPGAGKSTLAVCLASRLGLRRIDRDRIRAEHFPALGYTARDKAMLNEAVSEAAARALAAASVVIDGMTLSRAHEVTALRELADAAGAAFVPLMLDCPPEVAEARVAGDRGHANHPGADRDETLVRAVANRFEPPPSDVIALDATLPPASLCDLAVAALGARLGLPGAGGEG